MNKTSGSRESVSNGTCLPHSQIFVLRSSLFSHSARTHKLQNCICTLIIEIINDFHSLITKVLIGFSLNWKRELHLRCPTFETLKLIWNIIYMQYTSFQPRANRSEWDKKRKERERVESLQSICFELIQWMCD